MKIGIYVNNAEIPVVDCSELSTGNPGIGGTQYTMLLLAETYGKRFPEDEVVTYLDKDMTLAGWARKRIVRSLVDLAEQAVADRVDILVISTFQPKGPLTLSNLKIFEESELKVVTWGHNNYKADVCHALEAATAVKANVFVGRQQYDRCIDTKLINKSVVIYNLCPVETAKQNLRTSVYSHEVTYIGSLIPAKGFHILADSWKEIRERVPDAHLNVIGGGNLYDNDTKLGPEHIAEANYEKRILKNLKDKDGQILDSVSFLGVLGKEKSHVISHTSVGVVNPSGRTETFGISAIDFESRGVPVVTIAKEGFLDTVENRRTGILYSRKRQLGSRVVELLINKQENMYMGKNALEFSRIFSPQAILPQWQRLFERVINGGEFSVYQKFDNVTKDLKWARILNYDLKQNRGLGFLPAIVDIESSLYKLKLIIGDIRRNI